MDCRLRGRQRGTQYFLAKLSGRGSCNVPVRSVVARRNGVTSYEVVSRNTVTLWDIVTVAMVSSVIAVKFYVMQLRSCWMNLEIQAITLRKGNLR